MPKTENRGLHGRERAEAVPKRVNGARGTKRPNAGVRVARPEDGPSKDALRQAVALARELLPAGTSAERLRPETRKLAYRMLAGTGLLDAWWFERTSQNVYDRLTQHIGWAYSDLYAGEEAAA